MTRLTIQLMLVLACLATWSRASAARPDDIAVDVRLSDTKVYLGDTIDLQIQVNGSRSPEEPDMSVIKDADVQFMGGQDRSQHSVMIINGRRTENSFAGYVFAYQVAPTKAGVLRIPAISIHIDGREYKTSPLTVQVIEPIPDDNIKLHIEADKNTAYIGEPIKVKLVWYVSIDVSHHSFRFEGIKDKFDVIEPPDARADPQRQLRQDQIATSLNGRSIIGSLGSAELEGKKYTTLTIERTLVPKEGTAGSMSIGPARVACSASTGKRDRTWFDAPWDDLNAYERKIVVSPPLPIQIKELPTPAPAAFSGLIGEYKVESAATPIDVHVGDPIQLMVRIEGNGLMDRVPPLDLTAQPGFSKGFKIPSDPVLPTAVPSVAVFTQTIRPSSDAVREIPPVELWYFDPKAGSYKAAKSKPIPLTVRQTTEVTLQDEPGEKKPEQKSEAQDKVGGLAPLMKSPTALTSRVTSLAQLTQRPAWIVAVAAPPLLAGSLMLGAFLHHRSTRDPAGRRRRRALRVAQSRLRHAERAASTGTEQLAAGISAACRGFAADMLDIPASGITTHECVEYFKGHAPSVAGEIERVLHACESNRFAGADSGLERQTAGQVGTLLREASRAIAQSESSPVVAEAAPPSRPTPGQGGAA